MAMALAATSDWRALGERSPPRGWRLDCVTANVLLVLCCCCSFFFSALPFCYFFWLWVILNWAVQLNWSCCRLRLPSFSSVPLVWIGAHPSVSSIFLLGSAWQQRSQKQHCHQRSLHCVEGDRHYSAHTTLTSAVGGLRGWILWLTLLLSLLSSCLRFFRYPFWCKCSSTIKSNFIKDAVRYRQTSYSSPSWYWLLVLRPSLFMDPLVRSGQVSRYTSSKVWHRRLSVAQA